MSLIYCNFVFKSSQMSSFNQYGKPNDYQPPVLKVGDKVQYIDVKPIQIGKKRFAYKILLEGIWDGEKVQFKDHENTIVRTNWWLTKI